MKTAGFVGVLAVGAMLALGGCVVAPVAPSVMVLPGSQKAPAQFQADHLACQQEAQARLAGVAQVANNEATANVVIGTLLGAAAGALLGYGSYDPSAAVAWGAGTGLLISGTAAGGNSHAYSYSLQQQFNLVFMQCMYQRGHQVPGQVAYPRAAAAATLPPAPAINRAPPYPPPGYPPPAYPAPNAAPPAYPPPNTLPPS